MQIQEVTAMKKAIALILTALLLASCTKDTPVEPEIPVTQTPDYAAVTENAMEPTHAHSIDVEFQSIRGYIFSSMKESLRITEYLNEREATMSTTAPVVTIEDGKTYVCHRYPPEVVASGPKSEEEFYIFALQDKIQDYPNEILVYTDGSAEPEIIPLTGLDQRYIFDSMDYDSSRDVFTLVSLERTGIAAGETAMQIMEFDGTGSLIRRTDLAHPGFTGYTVWHFIGDTLYFNIQPDTLRATVNPTYYTDLDADYTVYRCDPWTGEMSEILTEIKYFTEQDGKLLYLTQLLTEDYQWEQALMCWDPADGTSEKLGELIPEHLVPFSVGQIFEAGYNADTGILYYSNGFGVKAYRPGDEEAVTILAKFQTDDYADTASLEPLQVTDNRMVVRAGNHQVVIYELPEEPVSIDAQNVPLNFCLFNQLTPSSDLHASVFRLMHMSGYPAKPVVNYESKDADEYAFTMAKKLLAGDTDFDIFIVTTEMSQLLKEGYYENLADYDILDEIYASMIPGVKRLCTVGDTASLFPLQLDTDMFRVTVDADLPSTFTELRNYNSDTPLLSAYNLRNLTLPWFEQFAANYMARDMDAEEATADLTALYETALSLKDSCHLGSGFTNAKTVLRVSQNLGKNASIPAGSSVLPMLPLTENYAPAVEGSFYAINPNSPNKELAAVFLAGMAHLDRNSNLYDTWDEKLTYSDGSETLFELYKSQIASGVRYYGLPDLMEMLTVHFDSLEAGTMTAEDAADELFRYIRMVKYE